MAARRFLEQEFSAGIILSEESDDHRFGDAERRWCENPFSHPRLRESLSANRRKGFLHESGRDRNLVPAGTQAAPVYRFIVDPVDGSDNWGRGLPLSSVAVAVLPAQGPIALDRVVAALVGGLDEETPIVAARGEGAQRGAEKLQASGTRRIADALVSCQLNHFAPTPQVSDVFARARAVRSYGCASQAIALVAGGAIDAHLDIRSRLTPESFLAAAAILREAGGCVLDTHGNPLPEFANIHQRTTIIAAATEELAREIIDALAGHNS